MRNLWTVAKKANKESNTAIAASIMALMGAIESNDEQRFSDFCRKYSEYSITELRLRLRETQDGRK